VRSSLIGKIEKAKIYDKEPERITLSSVKAQFRGENDNYQISYSDSGWKCSCNFFAQWGVCSHIMAMQQIFAATLPEEALNPPNPLQE